MNELIYCDVIELEKYIPEKYKSDIKIIGKVDKDYIIIETKYGQHKVQPCNLKALKTFPKACTSLDTKAYWRNRILELHPELLNIEVEEPCVYFTSKYGIGKTSIKSIIQKGYSIKSAINKTEYFINQCNEKHKNKYKYPNLKYTRSNEKILIECDEHGLFTQLANSHVQGSGCPKCTVYDSSSSPNTGWNETTISRFPIEKQNSIAYVYIIRLTSDNENFYKIGFSTNPTKRFHKFKPYSIEVIKLIKLTMIEAIKYEKKLLSLHKENKYIPQYIKCGKHECFNELINYDN